MYLSKKMKKNEKVNHTVYNGSASIGLSNDQSDHLFLKSNQKNKLN